MRRAAHALATTAVLLAAQSCCGVEPSGACIRWVRAGETYSVELVRRVTIEYSLEAKEPTPYSGYPLAQRSCGSGLDLDEGDTLQIEAGERAGPTDDRCSGGCYEYRAHARVDGVNVVEDRTFPIDIGQPYFRDQVRVKIGSECEGLYAVGVMPLEDAFRAQSPELAPTDFILFRKLEPTSEAAACDAPGSALLDEPSNALCYDSWFVRVRDSSGRLVSADLTASTLRSETDGG